MTTHNADQRIVAVAGATGKLGRLVLRELHTRGACVRALVRDPSKPEAKALLAEGADEIVPFAFGSSLADAVRGAYAVVSTVQGGPDVIVDGQLALLRAARDAGARRFFPSDYSYNLFALPEGININSDWRRTFADRAAKEAGSVEVVHVLQGIFTDINVLGFLGAFDREQNIVRYWGDGTAPIDWTTWEDTARFIAAAAVDDRPVPSQLFVAGDRMSILDFAAAIEKARGVKVKRERLGSLDDAKAETERRLAADPANMFAWLPLMYARAMFSGEALLGPLLNGRYPDIKPESVADAITRGAV